MSAVPGALPAAPLRLAGDAAGRGRAQARGLTPSQLVAVRRATVARAEKARADGLIDDDARAYLAKQRSFHAAHDPESLAELGGIAEGFGFTEDDLFIHLHLVLLQRLKAGRSAAPEGCSAWGVAESGDGPLLVKNRDISSPDIGVPCVTHHGGPDVLTGAMLCVGSLGNPAAYSSGINARGFALADTHVAPATPGVGWLRYFLMTRLLARCATVAEAVAMIRGAAHAGGGTLILADASGDLAAVEFDAGTATVTRGRLLWRTNHFVAAPSAADEDDAISVSSRGRFAVLARAVPAERWTVGAAARLMAGHRQDATGRISLCQHMEADAARTLSAAIYVPRTGRLTLSAGNPCEGRWSTYEVGVAAAAPAPAIPFQEVS